MSDINTGGPAFPTGDNPESRLTAEPGMTLRDYFAAKAMAAHISTYPCQSTEMGEHFPVDCALLAEDSYEMADAMIAARDRDTSL